LNPLDYVLIQSLNKLKIEIQNNLQFFNFLYGQD
jgi:hypothetical protein